MHTINMAELAAIDLGLILKHTALMSNSACFLRRIYNEYIPQQKTPLYQINTPTPYCNKPRLALLQKIKAHNNSGGNDQADHLANIIADGQPPYSIQFKCAHTHLGHWTWHCTTQHGEPNI
jgi:ribonuclease HI